jgi:hypothetical protein
MYASIVGYTAFLPVYLARNYLIVFALALALYRTVTFSPGRELTFAAYVTLLGTALAGAVLLGWLAPTIGERNFCSTWSARYPGSALWSPLPPHTFRCTVAPFAFVGFIGGWWIAASVLTRLVQRGE